MLMTHFVVESSLQSSASTLSISQLPDKTQHVTAKQTHTGNL